MGHPEFILHRLCPRPHLRQNPPLVGVQDGLAHGNTLWCDLQLLILQDVAQGLKCRIQTFKECSNGSMDTGFRLCLKQ